MGCTGYTGPFPEQNGRCSSVVHDPYRDHGVTPPHAHHWPYFDSHPPRLPRVEQDWDTPLVFVNWQLFWRWLKQNW